MFYFAFLVQKQQTNSCSLFRKEKKRKEKKRKEKKRKGGIDHSNT